MIEVEVQNETYQTQQVLRFAAVPRIGEGIHLPDEGGFSACFDVVDVWYQKAGYGDVWIPYIHVRKTPAIPATPDFPLPQESIPLNGADPPPVDEAAVPAERLS